MSATTRTAAGMPDGYGVSQACTLATAAGSAATMGPAANRWREIWFARMGWLLVEVAGERDRGREKV